MRVATENLQGAWSSLSPLHWLGIALAAVTALVHLVLGVDFLPHWMGIAFLVATAGFLLGIALVVFDIHRRLVYLAGIPFTATQLILWYDLNRPTAVGDLSALEVIDKVTQALLLAVLIALYRRERPPRETSNE